VARASIWEREEGPFETLAGSLEGAVGPVTLWWDGGIDAWVPWIWTGDGPAGKAPPEGVELSSEWGRFRLVGTGVPEGIPRAAWTRVAEDLVLRDLLAWERARGDLQGLESMPTDARTAPMREWFVRLARELGAPAALLWQEGSGSWRLSQAWGEGTSFRGELVLPEGLLTSTFDAPDTPWKRWDPRRDLCLHFTVNQDDHRWLLRRRRLELALGSGGQG
jgi:hypothetical protein